MLVYKLIRGGVVLNLEARVNSKGISREDVARHGRSGNLGERGAREGKRECKEASKGDCDSGERGFGSSVKETLFFPFPFFPSAVIARVFEVGYTV